MSTYNNTEKGIHTGNSTRDIVGAGGCINPHHGGNTKRSIEATVDAILEENDLIPTIDIRVWIDSAGNKHKFVDGVEVPFK